MTMTVSLRILLAMAGFMALAHSAHAASADADDDKRYGKCKAGADHAAVPAVKGLMYDKARKKLLSSGWMPHVLRNKDGSMNQSGGVTELGAPTKTYWQRGYKEVEECTGGGRALCLFYFADKFGNRLHVGTVGEELPERSLHAVVDYVKVQCPVR
jgi:hypothetical protein